MNDLAERHTLLDACPERTSAMNSSGFWNLFHPVGDHTDRGEPAAGRAGITRAIYGLTDDAASDLLRRHSQHSNLKLRDLAARLTEALPAVDIGTPVNTTRMDRMLAAIIGDGRQPTGQAS